MVIVLSCKSYPTVRPGGMLFVCQDRAEELSRQGHEVHVLLPGVSGKVYHHNGVNIHEVGGKIKTYSMEFACGCRQVCEEISPDIVHLDGVPAHCGRWWEDRPGDAKVYAATLHGFGPGGMLTRWNMFRTGVDRRQPQTLEMTRFESEIKIFETFDVVIGVSRAEHWYLQDIYGLPRTKLVYNPIPSYFFEPRVERKAFAPLVCADLTSAACRNFKSAQRVTDSLDRKVRIIKGVPRVDMPKVFDGAAALLLPTFYAQGYDLTVAEAEARGLPIIAAATGSYLMESWERPWIRTFRAGDDQAFREALTKDLPAPPPSGAADRHRPEAHVKNWMEALGL